MRPTNTVNQGAALPAVLQYMTTMPNGAQGSQFEQSLTTAPLYVAVSQADSGFEAQNFWAQANGDFSAPKLILSGQFSATLS